ncbi:MAG: sugar ABC transporter permease, partial [Myxococcales bacterium]|nr:sugar ABC transporter permease [Myxococcales bacterium]
MKERGWWVELVSHLLLVAATVFALYPVLWVITLALSAGDSPEARIIPWPSEPSLEHFDAVIFNFDDSGRWLFGRQLWGTILVAQSTALVAILIATPAAYAMSRFRFVGARAG